MIEEIKEQIGKLLADADETERVSLINELRAEIHAYSPFAAEPVDFVRWVAADSVHGNEWNPNVVAPPEMKLLELSIRADGYTQPIVSMATKDGIEVVDGFHRHRVGKESAEVRARVHGYLPVVEIRSDRHSRNDRIAATIRHNRARGKHVVTAMQDIVVELKRRNWSSEKIGRELGMEPDEVLRLCQMTGIAELFADSDFSASWDVDDLTSDDATAVAEVEALAAAEEGETRTGERVYHTFDKWECYPAGMYETRPPRDDMTADECRDAYAEFLRTPERFRAGLEGVLADWPHSTEHYLTNDRMNRIAWLGQAAMCHETRVPRLYRSGFTLLTDDEQAAANALALEYLNRFLVGRGQVALSMDEAKSKTEADLY